MKKYLTLTIFFFHFCFVQSQNNIDSLLTVFNNQNLHDTLRLNAIGDIAWFYLSSNTDSASLYAKKQLLFAREKKWEKWEAQALNIMSSIHSIKGDYANSLKLAFESLKIREAIGNKRSVAGSLNNIGTIYISLKDYPQALHYFSRALIEFKKTSNKYLIAIANGNVGNVYASLNDYVQAQKYHEESLKSFKEIGDEANYAQTLSNSAANYIKLSNFSKAKNYADEALKIAEKNSDIKTQILSRIAISDILSKEKKYDLAIEYELSTLELAKKFGSLEYLKEAHESLYRNYKQLKKPTEALYHYEQLILLKDSINKDENKKDFLRAEIQFEYDKKAALERAEQIKKDALAREKQKELNIILLSLAIGLVGFVLFTIMIVRRNRIVVKQKNTIEVQKDLILTQQTEMVDSITYAKRIQEAILPPISYIQQKLPDSFILFKPKAIVAGDFYWMREVGDIILIAAADCTGHGVPGALVSVVCSNALNRAVKEFDLTDTNKILDKTTELVVETFEKSASEVKDGMDISLLSINKSNKQIQWSGANNDLWYFAKNEFREIKADKQHIGVNQNQKPFTSHNIEYQKGMMLYLFTDGYCDQFGGPKGKKLKEKKFQEILHSIFQQNCSTQKEALLSSLENWRGNLEQVDDVCVIGIKL